MPTYIYKTTTGPAVSGTVFTRVMSEGTGTSGTVSISNIAAGNTVIGVFTTPTGIPGTDGTNGTYDIAVRMSTANTSVQVSVDVQQIASNGTVKNTSDRTAEQTASGTLPFSVDTSAWAWATGDMLRVRLHFRNTHAMSAQSCAVGLGTTADRTITPEAALVDTAVRVSFPTPPRELVGTQTFRARVRKTGSGNNPTAVMALWRNGVFVTTLVTEEIASEAVISGTAVLADVTPGSDVEIRLTGVSSATAQIEVGAIRWDAQVEALTTPTEAVKATAVTVVTAFDSLVRHEYRSIIASSVIGRTDARIHYEHGALVAATAFFVTDNQGTTYNEHRSITASSVIGHTNQRIMNEARVVTGTSVIGHTASMGFTEAQSFVIASLMGVIDGVSITEPVANVVASSVFAALDARAVSEHGEVVIQAVLSSLDYANMIEMTQLTASSVIASSDQQISYEYRGITTSMLITGSSSGVHEERDRMVEIVGTVVGVDARAVSEHGEVVAQTVVAAADSSGTLEATSLTAIASANASDLLGMGEHRAFTASSEVTGAGAGSFAELGRSVEAVSLLFSSDGKIADEHTQVIAVSVLSVEGDSSTPTERTEMIISSVVGGSSLHSMGEQGRQVSAVTVTSTTSTMTASEHVGFTTVNLSTALESLLGHEPTQAAVTSIITASSGWRGREDVSMIAAVTVNGLEHLIMSEMTLAVGTTMAESADRLEANDHVVEILTTVFTGMSSISVSDFTMVEALVVTTVKDALMKVGYGVIRPTDPVEVRYSPTGLRISETGEMRYSPRSK